MRVLIRGGRVLNAAGGLDSADLLAVDGVIAELGALGDVVCDQELDATGCLVLPGLVDTHTHMREPGGEIAETIDSATQAAALGGYTAVVAMPNTEPTIDSRSVVSLVTQLGLATGRCQVAVSGAITVGRGGAALSAMGEMFDAGVRLFTDDGSPVDDARVMLRALEYAASLRSSDGTRAVLAQHCEVKSLATGAAMHEGSWSSRLGLPGMPASAEEQMVARDIDLCARTGVPVHFLHLSTAGSVELVRRAKAAGMRVTAEVTPHHLSLTDGCLAAYDPTYKVNPPLRSLADVEAVRDGLVSGIIDTVATDHAPHPIESKEHDMIAAPCGMLGLQTALPLVLSMVLLGGASAAVAEVDDDDRLAYGRCAADLGMSQSAWNGLPAALRFGLAPRAVGSLSLARAVDALTARPAALVGLGATQGRPVAVGNPANLCVVDVEKAWTVSPESLASIAVNSPYLGLEMPVSVRHTVFAGTPVVVAAKLAV